MAADDQRALVIGQFEGVLHEIGTLGTAFAYHMLIERVGGVVAQWPADGELMARPDSGPFGAGKRHARANHGVQGDG